MYSNFLSEVGKLIYIIGEIQVTSNFKKLIDNSKEYRNKCFFKCVDQLPVNAYRKVKIQCRRRGILRRDWFTKILDRAPLMIFMVFNCAQKLQQNEKWQDRLSLIIRKINKVYDILKSSNKEDVAFRIIIIISKESAVSQGSGQSINVMDKITNFLKNYEKQLQIFQLDLLNKEINKHKAVWFNMIDKVYERKYRSIVKRMEESFIERRLCCLIKLAIMSEIMQKKQCFNQYQEAYRSLHYRYIETVKSNNDIISFDIIDELRTLADILLLRMLVIKVSMSTVYTVIGQMITEHLSFFSMKDRSTIFIKYKDILWKENFIHNLLQVLYINDIVDTIPHAQFAQLINAVVNYSYQLSVANDQVKQYLQQQQVKGRLIPILEPLYVGSTNYAMGLEITESDVIETSMNELLDKQKDFITRGIQIITRYKSMKIFKKHQTNFLNMYLFKFCILDDKLQSVFEVYVDLIKNALSNRNYYLLNHIANEIQHQIKKVDSDDHFRLLNFYSIAALISDYFQNSQELRKYTKCIIEAIGKPIYANKDIDLLSEEPQKVIVQPEKIINIPIETSSQLIKVLVVMKENFHPIEETLNIKLLLGIHKCLISDDVKYELCINFNHHEFNQTHPLKVGQQGQEELNLVLNLLNHMNKDHSISIESIVLRLIGKHEVKVALNHINYDKFNHVKVYTRLKAPQINIKLPYDVCYINETIKFLIQFNRDEIEIDTKFTVKEDEGGNKTEVFVSMDEKMNLVNSKCYHTINVKEEENHIFYLKCNKVGPKVLKFIFNLTVWQKIDEMELKNHYTVVKDVGLNVTHLFKTIKIIKQSISGNQILPDSIPINQKVILQYSLRTSELVNIIELGQNKNPKDYIRSIKEIPQITELIITPSEKLRSIYIFEALQHIIEDAKHEKVFLISFYIKWNRIDMDLRLGLMEDQPIENLYVEDGVKIGLKPNKVQIEYEQGKMLEKMKKSKLGIKYRNLTHDKVRIMSVMDNNQYILRIGSRAMQANLQPKQQKIMFFDVMGVKAGYHKYPRVRTYFNGNQIQQGLGNETICII